MKSLRMIIVVLVSLQVGSLFSAFRVASSSTRSGIDMAVPVSNDIPEGKRALITRSLNELQSYFNIPQAKRTDQDMGRANHAANTIVEMIARDVMPLEEGRELFEDRPGEENINQNPQQQGNLGEQEIGQQKYTIQDLRKAVNLMDSADYEFSPNSDKFALNIKINNYYEYFRRIYGNLQAPLTEGEKKVVIMEFNAEVNSIMDKFDNDKKSLLQTLKNNVSKLIKGDNSDSQGSNLL